MADRGAAVLTRDGHPPPARVEADEATAECAGGGAGETSELPARVGRYHVLGRIGAGAMGEVLAAYDPHLDRKVALKLLRRGAAGRSPARLLREAHALARLSHPNVVQIHDTDAVGDRVFLAMELVEGVDLRAWLAQPHPPAEVLRVLLDAGRGLAAAHDAGLVHRDFKPGNVLVGADGRVRVADFGLVRHSDDGKDASSELSIALTDPALTLTGALLGTPAYMSPEQHVGQAADARSDQFSFCVALWEALHGERPFSGDDPASLTAAVLSGRPRPPPRGSRVPRHLTAALERGLAAAPAERHPDMHVLLALLARDPGRARRRWLLGLGVAGLVAGAALLARRDAMNACAGGPGELAASWGDARRRAVAAALSGAADPDLPAHALAGLDAYADEWLAAHRDACLDHSRGEQSSALLDARARCLEHRRQALAVAADVLVANPGADAAQVVARLPAIASCADAAVVLAESPVPDPGVAEVVDDIESRLIAARVHHAAGDLAGALEIADAALQRARAVGFEPSIAAALLVQARVRFSEAGWELAREALSEALELAVRARRDDLAAEAGARLFYVDGVQLGRTEEALRTAPLMLALAARAPEPHAALGLAHNNLGGVQTLAHDSVAAAASFARGVEELRAAPGADPIDLASAELNAAIASADPTARQAGLAAATARYATHLGAEHLVTLEYRALAAAFAPEPAAARAALDAACPAYLRVHAGAPVFCAVCFHRLAHVDAFLGDDPAAREAAERGLTCRPGPVLDERDEFMRAKLLAFAALREGRPDAALAAADRGLAVIAPHLDIPWMAGEDAELRLLRGRALLGLGRAAEATAALEPTLPVFAAAATERPELLPRLWLAEARALLARAAAEPARAAELAAGAAATFTELGAVMPE
ncbi:MAG: protein kinase [Myxococcales bacterium]|nr:protein kinase [Myxococcales bacterium]